MINERFASRSARGSDRAAPPRAAGRPGGVRRFLGALALALALILTGCAAAPAEQELAGAGSPTPQGVVESFLAELNKALADPELGSPPARRAWSERLASYFAPSERADQRAALSEMLGAFADSASRPAFGSKVQLEVTYSGIEIISRSGDEALVRVVDGVFALRWIDANGEVVRERSGGLTDVIGQASGGLPVLRVGGSWFMTEG